MRGVLIVMMLASAAHADVSVAVTPSGVWLGVPGGKPCFVPRLAGAIDRPLLQAELRYLHADAAVSIAPSRGVTYQDFITVMDLAVAVGYSDTHIGARSELDVRFDDAAIHRRSARAHCTRPVEHPALFPDVARLAWAAVPIAKPSLATTPVIVITKTELSYQGRVLGDVAELTAASGNLVALQELLVEHQDALPTLIIQADATVDATLVQRATSTAGDAGFTNVLYAVKK